METFMRKYSFWITTVLGIFALAWLIIDWDKMKMIQKLPILYIIALAVHEIEETRLPGGFVELVTSMTGIEIKNIGIAKFGLLLFTLYATILPAFFAEYIWPVMATLFIGCIEIFAHLAAARINPKRFYSHGMITAVFIQFPITVYGYCYLFANRLIHGIFWLWAALFLLIPLFSLQALIVRSNGGKWSEFVSHAGRAMLTKEGLNETEIGKKRLD